MTIREWGVKPSADEAPSPVRLNTLDQIILALVLVLTSVVYVGALSFEFVFDDRALIIDNPLLRSWRFIPRYFIPHLTNHMVPHLPSGYYRPVLLLWLFVNYTLFHLRPWYWHLTTLAAHVVVTLAVYLLSRQILGDRLTAGLAALVFGLHPVHVESVAWVMGVTEPLVAMLFIPSFLCYLRSREATRRARVWSAVSLLVYGLAMLAKETALTLPLIIIVYEWVFREPDEFPAPGARQRFRAAMRAAAPYLILTIPYLVARAIVLKGLSHTITYLPISTLIFTCPLVLWSYLRLLAWPFGLSAFYDVPYVTTPDLSNFLLPAVGLAAITAGLGWCGRRSPAAAFATACLVLPILPVLNLRVFPEAEIVHDRYLYLPSVGFSILVALALRRLSVSHLRQARQPLIPILLAAALIGTLGFGTVSQSLTWANNLLLYRRGVSVAPRNNMARNNLANELVDRGLYNEAIDLYQQVLAEKPDYWLSNYNLGFAYYKLEKLPEAERYLRRAVEINPIDSDQFVYLGLTWMKMGRLDEAAGSIRHAISMRPQGAGYHFALGVVMKMKSDFPAALEDFKAELANNPQQEATRQQIAEIETRLGGKH